MLAYASWAKNESCFYGKPIEVKAELMSFNMIGIDKANQELNGGVSLFRLLQRTVLYIAKHSWNRMA